MRAALYTGKGGAEVIAFADVPEPAIGPDDALVEVAYAGLNRADVLERMGRYPAPRLDPPVPGLEFSGVVRAVGANVRNVTPGDRVCGLVAAGAHAEFVAADALTLARVPDSEIRSSGGDRAHLQPAGHPRLAGPIWRRVATERSV